MLYRKKMQELINWKSNENTALLVDGARQVGKTSLIEEFIKSFNNYIEIDFTKDATALSLLLEVKNYDDFVNRLSIISPIKLNNKDDILFLDEIQYYYEIREKRIQDNPLFKEKYIDIITLTKEIVNRGEFRIILSGSLLGVSILSINLNPTGYLRKITMYPLDFEEFLLANNISQGIINEVEQCFKTKTPVSDSLNELLINKFREYVLVGGFPQAVQAYINDKSLEQTTNSLETINNWYKADIIKYADKKDRIVILEMYNLLPGEIMMKNRKFIKSHLTNIPNFRNLELKDRFLWLKNAGVAIPTYNVSNPIYPLTISIDHKLVKLFMSDSGLLTHFIFDRDAKRKLLVDPSNVDLGAPYENAVAQLLLAHGFEPRFHSRVKYGEVDFIIERNMKVIPIEIKAGKPDKKSGLYSHLALNNLLISHKDINDSWVFGLTNVKKENNNITMFPIYMIEFVRR